MGGAFVDSERKGRLMDRMETLNEAVARLESCGYDAQLRALPDGYLRAGDGEPRAAEDFVVEEIVRFEGVSDPEDESALFALRSRDGKVAGTLVATYGPQTDPDTAEVLQRLDAGARGRRRHAADGD